MSTPGAPRMVLPYIKGRTGFAAPTGGAGSEEAIWKRRRKGLTLRASVLSTSVSRGATLTEVGSHVISQGKLLAPSLGASSAFAAYELQCLRHAGTPPLPPDSSKILGFLFTELDRGLSNSGMGTLVSALTTYFARAGYPLSDGEKSLISDGRRLLEAEFPSEVRRARPLSDASLLRVRSYLDPYIRRGDLFALEWWALLTTGYAGLYRGCEVLGGALTWEQVTSIRTRDGYMALVLDVPFRKASKNVRDKDVDVHVVPARPGSALDPYPAMKAYADASGARFGTRSGPVFPLRFKKTGLTARQDGAYPDGAARAHLRWLLEKAGVPEPSTYGLHSMRRGGATMLLAAGVDWASVKKLGAWRSNAAELYDARGADLADSISETLRLPPRRR